MAETNATTVSLRYAWKRLSFHKWHFETIRKRNFGLLMEDGFVYFAIVDEVSKRSSVLDFQEHLRDELKKADRKNSRGSFSGTISFSNVQDQLVRRLIASLERVAETDLICLPLSSPSIDGAEQNDAANSTLLGRSSKQEKKKRRDQVVNTIRGIELEKEERESIDRGNVTECSNASPAAATYMFRQGDDLVVLRALKRNGGVNCRLFLPLMQLFA